MRREACVVVAKLETVCKSNSHPILHLHIPGYSCILKNSTKGDHLRVLLLAGSRHLNVHALRCVHQVLYNFVLVLREISPEGKKTR
jgi:hypothetical protein